MKRLLLLGAGHAHLEVIRQFQQHLLNNPDVECILASPHTHTVYSGMLPGFIAGHYSLAEIQIDAAALARAAGWRFIQQPLLALDRVARVAMLADGTRVNYDILSIDTGSVADFQDVTGAAAHALPLRPFDAFLRVWQDLLAEASAGRIRHVGVVGAGAAGVEIALAIAYHFEEQGIAHAQCGVVLLSDTEEILASHPPAVRRRFERLLADRHVSLHCGNPVTEVGVTAIRTSTGDTIAADAVIWATAGGAPDWPKNAGIATDERGFIAVDRHLRSISNPEIFGGGDIVSLTPSPHPKSGVYAVRHGAALAANLRAVVCSAALRTFTPQRRALSLISAGGKYALASWGRWSVSGQWVWAWKNRIDRAYVAKYRVTENNHAA